MDLKSELINFIKCKENNGAILVTGKWGCGKSYLIREVASEINLQSEYMVVMISLFGIDSLASMEKKLKENIFGGRILQNNTSSILDKLATWKKHIKRVTSVMGEYIPVAKGIHTALSLNMYDLINVENKVQCFHEGKLIEKILVLVFDDFERCKMDHVDLLGVINDYSENLGIKTIIVADESKIQDEKYKEFKEKVISRTVRLLPDFDTIITGILKEYDETVEGYGSFLRENIGILCQVFDESTEENLRIFKTFIMDFERAYDVWMNNKVPPRQLPSVLYAFGAMYFEVKASRYKKHDKYGYLFTDNKMCKKYNDLTTSYMLESLKYWVAEGTWDEESFLHEIQEKFGEKTIAYYKRLLNYNFWELDYKIIEKGMLEAVELAYTGKLNCQELISLMGLACNLTKLGIGMPCEIDYEKVMTGINLREEGIKNGEIEEPECHTFLGHELLQELPSIAQELYNQIEMIQNRKEAWACRRRVLEYFRSPSSFDMRSIRNHSIVSIDNTIVSEFLKAYINCRNSEKRHLFSTLRSLILDEHSISKQSDIKLSLTNLSRLYEELLLLAEKENDPITKYIISKTAKEIFSFSSTLQEKINSAYSDANLIQKEKVLHGEDAST